MNARSKSVLDWKDGEFEYCASLVEEGGNRSVPRDAVESYLEVQVVSARQDGRQDVVEALGHLQMEWTDVLACATCY